MDINEGKCGRCGRQVTLGKGDPMWIESIRTNWCTSCTQAMHVNTRSVFAVFNWEKAVGHILVRNLGFRFDWETEKYRKIATAYYPIMYDGVMNYLTSGIKTLRRMKEMVDELIEMAEDADRYDLHNVASETVQEILTEHGIWIDSELCQNIDEYIYANVAFDYDKDSLLDKEFDDMKKITSKKPIEIYFSDLVPETQKAIVDLLGGNGNYDLIAIATIKPYDEEDS